MPNWTPEQFRAHEANVLSRSVGKAQELGAVNRERDLHDDILDECERRLWWVIHSRMDRKTTIGKGVCDFIIFADKGRTLYIECKSATGKLSQDQLIFIAWMRRLGHAVHVVTSFQQFLELTR